MVPVPERETMSDSCVVVGVLARVADEARAAVAARCEALPGVSTFAVDAPGQIGLLIEARDLEEAHDCLRERIDVVPGVLGTWPVTVEWDTGCTSGSEG
ncbi:MAG: chaperone NapD [Planctomycetota bacterium]